MANSQSQMERHLMKTPERDKIIIKRNNEKIEIH